MKKNVALLLAIMMTITSLISTPAYAAGNEVTVKIAPYYTQIENVSVDNRYVEYPLLTYKDITYFPMTYNLCAFLGMRSGFDAEKGLYITSIPCSYDPSAPFFGGSAVNYTNKAYKAVLPTYPIYLNGQRIDNSKEEYPLLNFRGITYFPMTWRFAYEELCFDITWSDEEYAFYLKKGDPVNDAFVYAADDSHLYFKDQINVYEVTKNEYGGNHYSLKETYYHNFSFDLETEVMTRLPDTAQSVNYGETLIRTHGKLDGTSFTPTYKDGAFYLDDELLLTQEVSSGGQFTYTPSSYGTIFDLGDCSLIYLTAYTNSAPAPYTGHNEYLFVKDASGIRSLDWDTHNNFSGVYADGTGGYYIASSGYSPAGMSRWSNSFSDVYYFDPAANTFTSLVSACGDTFNSIRALGSSDGKLYLEAIYFEGTDKNTLNVSVYDTPISTVESGFYALDLASGKLEKIYPYIHGEVYFAPNGALYISADYAREKRLINLKTGKVILFE